MGHKRRARETNLSLPLSSTTVCCDSYFRPDHRSGCERERERERGRERQRERERETGEGEGDWEGARKGERERRGERERCQQRFPNHTKSMQLGPGRHDQCHMRTGRNCLGKQRAHLVAICIFIHLRHVTTHENTATRPLRTKRPRRDRQESTRRLA